ncbi:MAG: hypothetical protein FWD15_00900 [Alphaproteobacteria bacterium]|nr:hypothetical protein [Alphaproteobacteria bacterium]
MEKDTLGGVFGIVILVIGFYGYILNIAKIWECKTRSCRITRVVGAITTAPGVVMGFMDFK